MPDRVRKPRQLKKNGKVLAFTSHHKHNPPSAVVYTGTYYAPDEMRKVAAWLTQAAAWIEQKEGKETQP